ncbi:hypothetical protein DLH97_25230 [Vibrio parahaemolyticus]|nr:hypothetical protein [Vibrio parahaemolyticus]EGR2875418.1 hypothetical protein [Vibrio parahaemolyticus]
MVLLFVLITVWLVVFFVGLVLKPSVYKMRFILVVVNTIFLFCIIYFMLQGARFLLKSSNVINQIILLRNVTLLIIKVPLTILSRLEVSPLYMVL